MKTAHDLVVAAKQSVQEISVDQAVEAIQSCDLLIDVRESEEYMAGFLPGAVHMSRGMLEFKMANNPNLQARDMNIVLYCKTSGRAALSAQSLAQMGYTHVRSIAGGVDAWQAAGHTLVKPAQPSFE
ncbi:MAG: sulfurtransferase [Burkholderiales bacterium 35-55-47]|jgi:rhodanese-related sulfurtransferase|uniref:rhodanese-like domain-containing protein n=1 Tax=Limnohabitans sp. TaxID=1907725 RepID=UPI000BCEC4BB|nr:rhodanese-like domain-containing protein [Limnohabitans sp.]OYY19155.1 MAG: sulfurtransferase [Burkholderiales bacterium 35-55-47]OYZ73163.1 MAG: sulfurtransferase [Burkholderiales bacterium 24-55-52]OZB00319.1 MAG: sulfurtransferase [Burkholderiales bacterium 39-55-53]HQR87467.1 rhodanese-like domain-containing protein [Limnohabitans sp.]HQS26741.1 rhodanese-like domain-containing protein [Limnohabitans sp.]